MTTPMQPCASRLNDQDYYMRNPRLLAITTGTGVILLVNEQGETIEHATLHASGWSLLLQCLANPLSGSAMQEYTVSLPDFDEQLCERLLA